ncbi:MAG: hypothetical protein WDZ30_00250 [Cellvibrionaceae bacterium]
MSGKNSRLTGQLIQAYVEACWCEIGEAANATTPEPELNPALRERIDVLGRDCEQLLDVEPEAVMAKLERLEYEAAREDDRVVEAANRVRAKEKAMVKAGEKRRPRKRYSRWRR